MNPVDISIYGIIDPARTKGRDLGILASEAVAGSVTLLQYRHKSDDVREMIRQATAIREAVSGTGIPLLINDRVDVALAVEADGVHLGQGDGDPKEAEALTFKHEPANEEPAEEPVEAGAPE